MHFSVLALVGKMTMTDLDPTFIKALRLLHSKSKDSADQLKQMLDDVLHSKKGQKVFKNRIWKFPCWMHDTCTTVNWVFQILFYFLIAKYIYLKKKVPVNPQIGSNKVFHLHFIIIVTLRLFKWDIYLWYSRSLLGFSIWKLKIHVL